MLKTAYTILFLLISVSISYGITSNYSISADSVFKHISVLADDSLEGRQVGEPGELKAAEYIRDQFQKAGLESKNLDNYFQYYDFIKLIDFSSQNSLIVNGTELKLYDEFHPLKQSASTVFDFSDPVFVDYGIKTEDSSYNDYENLDVSGKAVIIKRYAPSSDSNPHVDFDKYSGLVDKINTAIEHDAKAVIFYTPPDHDDTLIDRGVTNIYPKDIPILFLKRTALEKLNIDLENPKINSLSGQTDLVTVRDTAQNVLGYLDAGNDTTVIIGAHYDHLGYGGPTSLYAGSDKQIHNGADDNASGVAALLELARFYANAAEKPHYSLLFFAISGEEAGLLGANNFAKNMNIDSTKVRMMINMDMIGRLKDQENGLAVLGVGTCEDFKVYFDSVINTDLKIAQKESGTGPSDHTIFYNRKIPVLHLFTGAHHDYHKPTDDAEKIDNEGIVKVANLVVDFVNYFDEFNKPLEFKKTKDESEGKRSRKYSVSLGVMPDYVAEVKGLRIDGVMDDRPAANAGILEGDIVIKMGDIEINDIYDYMNALSKFRKGDTTTTIIVRDGEEMEFTVIF
ncbi:MAG: PDZ domain-containing protein [Calditrichaeota bacterium]|nr:MAG: PDZ domain-containing protein [Calditrichota bacterium]